MQVVLQRVRKAAITVDGGEVACIGQGLVALVGFSTTDEPGDRLADMARRLISLRLFDDEHGRLNRSLQDVGGELLVVPQITLTASLAKGTRPSFHTAAAPDAARSLFEAFVSALRTAYPRVLTGQFQSHMVVMLENDGPVTVALSD